MANYLDRFSGALADAGGAKPILAATSLSPRSSVAQRRAGALARSLGAPLYLLHVLGRRGSRRAEVSARARLLATAASLRDRFGVRVEISVTHGAVVRCIVERARALQARLVVVGAGVPGGLRQLWQLSRASSVRRRVNVPVLVVRHAGDGGYRQIVLATELSAHDAATLAALRRQHPGAALHLVHICDWLLLRPLRHAFYEEQLKTQYRRQAEAAAEIELRRFAREQGIDCAVSLHAPLGHVATGLRSRARQLGADLLVLRPKNSRLEALLGASVTASVLGDPPCDVLLARRLYPMTRERQSSSITSANSASA